MKNIAIFCDGTWQYLDQRVPTNVAKLARAVLPRSKDDAAQFVYYDDGVGVSQGVLDAASHMIGGVLGEGLDYKVVRAYEFLCLNYQPGDRIFIFGFSRGAYTARSLAGLIRQVWILRREEASAVFEAMSLYRSSPPKGSPPADEARFQAETAAFRAAHSYPQALFTGDKAYNRSDASSLAPDADEDSAWLQYVGVWETVGSLGVPANLPFAAQLNQKYRFYDTSLSWFVRSARHAVAIDERRKTFTPTLWDNIAALNQNAHANALPYDERPYQQQWFPGQHKSVGGGEPDGGLSLLPMLWVAEGAGRAGLAFDETELALYAAMAHANALFPKEGFSLGEFALEIDGMQDRQGPASFDEVSMSARLRWALMAGYRPNPLATNAAVAVALAAFTPPAVPAFYKLT